MRKREKTSQSGKTVGVKLGYKRTTCLKSSPGFLPKAVLVKAVHSVEV